MHRLMIFTPQPAVLADFYCRLFGLQVGQHVIGLDHAATGQHQGKDFLAQGGQAGAPRCTVFFCGSQELSGRKQRHSTGL